MNVHAFFSKQQVKLSTILQQLQSKFEEEELDEIYREFRKELAEEDYGSDDPKAKQRHENWLEEVEDDEETAEMVWRKVYQNQPNKKAEKQKEWRDKNKEHIKAYDKKYNEEHKQSRAEYLRQWRAKNKEHTKAYDKKYAQEHKEERVEITKRWKQKNREKAREHQRQYRLRQKEKE